MKSFSAGRQHADVGALAKYGTKVGNGKQMLAIVEHQQQVAASQAVYQPIPDRLARSLATTHGPRNLAGNRTRRTSAGSRQIDEYCAVGEGAGEVVGGDEGKMSLADTRRPRSV
jgi:hypothetical protein